MPKVLGIDPGSIITGIGIVDFARKEPSHIFHGVIKPPSGLEFPSRIDYFHEKLSGIIDEFSPEVAALEKVFVSANPSSALKLGLIRGSIMLSLRIKGLEIIELSPREVKVSLTGYGGADKEQVSSMVRKTLGIERSLKHDESDALAIAVCGGIFLKSRLYSKIRGG